MIIYILKYLKKIISFSIKYAPKLGPLVLLLQLYWWFRGHIQALFTSIRVIRESFVYLNRLPVFRLFKNILRTLSIISLLFNLIIFAIYTNFSILNWIPAMPALSQGLLFVYDSSPESTQNFISWIALKIKTFVLWIWNGLLDIIRMIIKAVLGDLENIPRAKPEIPPVDKDKYGDIHNQEYLQWLCNKLDEYKYYIIVSFLIFLLGGLTFLYWDLISGSWRTRGGDEPRGDDPFPPYNPQPIERDSSLPSVSTDSSGGFQGYFRKTLLDRLNSFKDKTSSFFKAKKAPTIVNKDFPRGIYFDNGREMYNGLPLTRLEVLPNGTEYYFNKDTDGFIRVVNNNYGNSGFAEIINPFTNKAISTKDISINERISLINKARSSALFEAPENSYSRHPDFEFTNLSRPEFSTTSAASSSNIPGTSDGFEDIPLGPKDLGDILSRALAKGKNKETSIPDDINPEERAFSSGSTTPTQSGIIGSLID